MAATVTLSASAAYGTGGKQYIARITGRDAKFTFSRDFVGRKGGKRGESSEYTTDEPGLYLTCDIDRKSGKDETYYLVYDLPGYGLTALSIDKDEMMDLAKRLDAAELDWTREALSIRLAQSAAKDPDGEVTLRVDQLGLTAGKVKRSDLVVALRRALATGEAPFDASAVAEQIKDLLSGLTNDQVAEVYRLLPGVEHAS